jgi:mono/diheme cytochrome c family protein
MVGMRSGFGRTVWLGMFAAMMLEAGCSDEAARPTTSQTGGQTAEPPAASGPAAATDSPSAPGAAPDARSPEELAAAGRSTYNANCIACHAMDPRIDGALGPAVAGASLELIEARVMRSEYPTGYVPKRATRVMVPMPHLQPKLTELAAYLASLNSLK